MKVIVLRTFDAYPNGKKTTFGQGAADIPKSLVEDCNMVNNGLVSIPKDKKPESET